MRKTFGMLAVACGLSLSFLLSSCGGNGPKAVVDEALTALKEGDAEDLMDCIYLDDMLADAESWRDFEDNLPENLKHQLSVTQSVAPMLQNMLKNVSWKFGDVEQDGDQATVTVRMKRDGEDELTTRVKVIKDKGGRWKIKSMGDLM